MRGFDVIRLFHERAPTVPLIAISGYAFSDTEIAGPEFLRLATRLGATRCLLKPFKRAILLGMIDECLSADEPHRRRVATSCAVGPWLSEPQAKPNAFDFSIEAPHEPGPLIGHATTPGFEPATDDSETQ